MKEQREERERKKKTGNQKEKKEKKEKHTETQCGSKLNLMVRVYVWVRESGW